jgi:hypothetical protein
LNFQPHNKRVNVRVASDTMGVAKLSLVNTVDFCDWDVLSLEAGSSFLVLRCKLFAVTAPKHQTSSTYTITYEDKTPTYQGAKNSTSISSSLLTNESKLSAVRSITSEAATKP